MKYTIVISKSAEKELNNLPLKDFLSIDKKILALAENPHPAGVRKLTGYKYHFRLRSGKYRIFIPFAINNSLLKSFELDTGKMFIIFEMFGSLFYFIAHAIN